MSFTQSHAVDNEEVSLESIFPNLISNPEEKKEDAKPSFWNKLSG
ncbi:Uncharacterized conserved protein [Streptococcus suis 05ZYH33]|nr:Uncharacterized conserved protein [Streptococcus suis 05ZYH33]